MFKHQISTVHSSKHSSNAPIGTAFFTLLFCCLKDASNMFGVRSDTDLFLNVISFEKCLLRGNQ